jgi:hypothetical protein
VTRARIIAFYLPQFHPIPENDEWWGKGFTEWTNVARARPIYPGHLQPRLPGELGFYDLRVPETRAAQSALAREYGVEGFCYWHYWFEGRRILERPFQEVLESGEPDLPFCLGWANQTWTGIWHGAADKVLIAQTYAGQADARRHFQAVLPAFKDPRYLCVDGRPIFMLHRPTELPESHLFTRLWQDWARAEGLPGVCFLADGDVGLDGRDYGFDGTLMSNPWRVRYHRAPSSYESVDMTTRLLGWPKRIPYTDVLRYALAPELRADDFPMVLPNWDNTPRSGKAGLVITSSTPDLFRQHLEQAIASVECRPFERRLIFLKSWNEWAEGNFVEPDAVFGRGYLEAIRQAQCGVQ